MHRTRVGFGLLHKGFEMPHCTYCMSALKLGTSIRYEDNKAMMNYPALMRKC